MTERAYFAASGAVAVVTASLVWFSTLLGPGSTPDSLQYLFAAQDVLAGKSLGSLSRHWPPGYSLLLTLPLFAGWDPASALRVLHTSLAFLNVLLFSACVRPVSAAPSPVSLLATVSFALAPGMLAVSIMAWSEPPFLAWLMAAFLALRVFLSRGSTGALFVVALFLGAALLTRYAAISFVGAIAVSVVVLRGSSDRRAGLFQGALLFFVAVLPLAAWLLSPADAGSPATPRSLVFHPVDTPRLLQGASVMGEWFQSAVLGAFAAAAIGLGSIVLVAFALRADKSPQSDRSFIAICASSVLGYLVFLVLSISFFDYYTPLDLRILCPALVMFAIAVGVSATRVSMVGSGQMVAASCVLAIPLLAGLPELSQAVSRHMREVNGYFSPLVRGMPILAVARDLPPVEIYSNAPEMLRLGSDRIARMLPAAHDMVRNLPAPDYVPRMDALVLQLREGSAAVVYLDAFRWRTYLPDASVFSQAGVGAPFYEGPDGWVLSPSLDAPNENQGMTNLK